MIRILFTSLFFFTVILNSDAQLSLNSYFQDHMIFQRNDTTIISGKATPSSTVELTFSRGSQTQTTTADEQGNFAIPFEPGAEGGPFSITLKNKNATIKLSDILVGDVWLCSGQSNMEWKPENGITKGSDIVAKTSNDNIRWITIQRNASSELQSEINGKWETCSPNTNSRVSAVAFFYARMLQDSLKIPIGLVSSSWGGTKAEQWMDEASLKADNRFKSLLADYKTGVKNEMLNPFSTALYNGMIHPLIDKAITGVIWYQGESNAGNPLLYADLFPALIENWRAKWKSTFPFYFVQLASYRYGEPIYAAMTREAQKKALDRAINTGMAVTMDIGDLNDIHPQNKQDVGERLALQALQKHYGENNIQADGPVLDEWLINERKVIMTFKNMNFNSDYFAPLNGFTVAGEDGKFMKANAYIQGNQVIVDSPYVNQPKHVRFGYEEELILNFVNEKGLPASPFRTDDIQMELPPK